MSDAVFTPTGLDALPPAEMARKAEDIGVTKAGMATATMFALGMLAGAFIALGAIFATTVTAGGADLPYGVSRLLGGVAFSLGLILVVVAGAELFTGNNLIVMAWASRRVSTAGCSATGRSSTRATSSARSRPPGSSTSAAVHVRRGRRRRAGLDDRDREGGPGLRARRSRSGRCATRSSASPSG